MGLDQTLVKRSYVGNQWLDKKDQVTIKNNKNTNIKQEKVSTINEYAGTWRKANQIHKWFVDNIQKGNDDGKEYYVSIEKLKELLVLVNKVLHNKALAGTLLPTQEGFFFGSTDYDDYYFESLEETKLILKEALADPFKDYYYSSSW